MKKERLSGSDTDSASVDRRKFLGGLAAAGLPLVAGCTQLSTSLTEHAFEATPVFISEDDAEALGYRELVRESKTSVAQSRSYGLDVRATITNQYAVYTDDTADEAANGHPRKTTVSVLSTPKAHALFDERNPLMRLSSQRLLYNETVQWFREPAGLEKIDREWERNSTRLSGERTDILGESTWFTIRAGLFDDVEDPSILFAYYSKLGIEEDAIFLYFVRQWNVDATDRPLIGEDGYLTEDELADDVATAKLAFNSFRRG